MSGYSERFQDSNTAAHYDAVVYSHDSYDAFIWMLQQQRLHQFLQESFNTEREYEHLDFACGAGRILEFFQSFDVKSTGVDISPQMIAIARQKAQQAVFTQGDVREKPNLLGSSYDIISAFRFFLNAEPPLRTDIMKILASRLKDRNSRFIFNAHGNSKSFRHLSIWWRLRRGETQSEMSLDDVKALVQDAGLEIESWYGFGICPAILHRTFARRFVRFIDTFAARSLFARYFSYDLLFVCKVATRDE